MKDFKKKLKAMSQLDDNQKKSGIMLIVYIVIIFFAVITVRSFDSKPESEVQTTPTPTLNVNSDKTKTTQYDDINSNNYDFLFTIKEDNNTIIYTGKKYNNKQAITKLENGESTKYYKLNDLYLDSSFKETDIPYKYSGFFDITKLKKVLYYGTMDEESDSTNKKYEIVASDIYSEIFSDESYDSFTVVELADDNAILKLENDQVHKIELTLNNFIKYYSNNAITTLKIQLEYSNFGNVEDFDVA